MSLKIVVGLGRNDYDRDLILKGLQSQSKLFHEHSFVITNDKEELMYEIKDADVFFGYKIGEDIFSRAERLKWVHISLAGVNHTMHKGLMDPAVKLSSSKGLHPPYISEHIIAGLLYFCSGFDKASQLQKNKQWERDTILNGQCLLAGKNVLILGLGHIGLETGKKLSALGASVSGIKRNVTEKKVSGISVYSMEELYGLLPEMDAVVDILPLTPETEGIVHEKFFEAMKPGSIFINEGRGQHVSEKALIENTRHLRGMVLDATAPEPVPADSPLWERENVLLTQHTSGDSPEYLRLTAEYFMNNLALYVEGKEINGLIDKEAGY